MRWGRRLVAVSGNGHRAGRTVNEAFSPFRRHGVFGHKIAACFFSALYCRILYGAIGYGAVYRLYDSPRSIRPHVRHVRPPQWSRFFCTTLCFVKPLTFLYTIVSQVNTGLALGRYSLVGVRRFFRPCSYRSAALSEKATN